MFNDFVKSIDFLLPGSVSSLNRRLSRSRSASVEVDDSFPTFAWWSCLASLRRTVDSDARDFVSEFVGRKLSNFFAVAINVSGIGYEMSVFRVQGLFIT